MKKSIIVIAIVIGLICSQCSLFDKADQPVSLKESLEANAVRINSALDEISATSAFQLITAGDLTEKSETASYEDSIKLDLIAGIYEYQPDTMHVCRYNHGYKLFKKTGDSDSLIVKLPRKMVFHPAHLHHYDKVYEVPENNFTIAASDYHYYYTLWNGYDYKLNAALMDTTADVGTLSILALGELFGNQSCSAEFTFPEGFNITSGYETGDTSTMEFALRDETELLLGETIVFIKADYENDDDEECEKVDYEWQYTLSIGNIDIKRSTGIDSIQVFLDGVLQKHAAEIIDNEAGENANHSVCNHRDILLTFDDGTTAKLSELIGPALAQMRELVDSLRSMRFAQRIVDYIAFNIYYSKQWEDD